MLKYQQILFDNGGKIIKIYKCGFKQPDVKGGNKYGNNEEYRNIGSA